MRVGITMSKGQNDKDEVVVRDENRVRFLNVRLLVLPLLASNRLPDALGSRVSRRITSCSCYVVHCSAYRTIENGDRNKTDQRRNIGSRVSLLNGSRQRRRLTSESTRQQLVTQIK